MVRRAGSGVAGYLSLQSLASCRAALSEIELSGECLRAALGESQPSTRRHILAVPPPGSWRLTLDLAAPQENPCRGHLPLRAVSEPNPNLLFTLVRRGKRKIGPLLPLWLLGSLRGICSETLTMTDCCRRYFFWQKVAGRCWPSCLCLASHRCDFRVNLLTGATEIFVQSLSLVLTLHHPMDCSVPGFTVLHYL